MSIPKSTASDRLIERYPELAELGKIEKVTVLAVSDYGRVEKLELSGSSGKTKRIGAVDFRLAVSGKETPLRSSWYRLVDGGDRWQFEGGRGFGHAVGLCQYGSEQMGKEGKDCVEILNFYYPQAVLLRAY